MMKRITLKGLACGLILAFGTTAHADDYQKYYDTGAELFKKVRSCSTLTDQTSAAVTRCLDESSTLIIKKTNDLKLRYAAVIKSIDRPAVDLLDTQNNMGKLKQSCTTLYPEALRGHFKNQIRSCQIHLDLNRFFYLYDHIMISGQG